MPAKEIKELRQAGKLEEAYSMAKAELLAEPDNVWTKRNISWVLYSQLDAVAGDLASFLSKLNELKELGLPETEEMLFENISIVISKAARKITGEDNLDLNKLHQLFDAIKELPIKRNSKWFSVLYGAFHKGMKESNRYIEFADWWNFDNLKPEDYQKEKMPNGREIMALAEQGYIAYAKHLLPVQIPGGEMIFDREKVEAFLPKLTQLADNYPQFQYPAYYQAKLLMAMGDKENILSTFLPFAKKKQNDFWVWALIADIFPDDADKVFSCYCRALTCNSPEEMLVRLRQRMASLLVSKNFYEEAKTEIELCIKARGVNGWKIPAEIVAWQSQEWYKKANVKKSNYDFYNEYIADAESILYSDVPEETVIVDFVNSDRQILNFIASESKVGYFKYERFLRDISIGDTLNVRFQSGSKDGLYKVYTATKVKNEEFEKQFLKQVDGTLRIPEGKSFGFLGDVFIHPSLIVKYKISHGLHLKANAMKTYNQDKKQWGWKLINIIQ